MLRWMSEVTRKDGVRNKYMTVTLWTLPIEQGDPLRWFQHVL